MTVNLHGVIFHQVMPDNSGGDALDSDGDGEATQEDEFVALQNLSSLPVDLSGWQIWSISAGYGAPNTPQSGLVHEFAEGTILAPGEPLWVITEISTDLDWAVEASEGGQEGSNLLTEGYSGDVPEAIALVNPDGVYIVFNMSTSQPDFGQFADEGFGGRDLIGTVDGDAVQDDPEAGYSYQFDPATGTYFYGPAWVPCFAQGTLIETPLGYRAVETIQEGDLVMTRDRGARPVIYRQCREVVRDSEDWTDQAPVEFKPGSLGPHLPLRSMVVSPQHRVLMVDQSGQEVLAPAVGLLDRPKVRRKFGMKRVRYHHLLLDHHAILIAEGVAVESLYASDQVLQGLSLDARAKVLRHYPNSEPLPKPARPFICANETRSAREWHLRADGFVIRSQDTPGVDVYPQVG